MKIEHIAIWSKDIETLKQFYETYFCATSNNKYTNKTGHEIIGDPRRTGDGYYESVVLDPEGNRIEITV
jgi:predicted enzyme related to lactoylglutathione lyase